MAGTYTFLPWTRKGLGNQISQPASAQSRATVVASARLTDGDRTAPAVTQTFQMTGPGDVTGLDPDAIVRVEPKNWVTDFEPNYLPFVEFYAEDTPWRYTPRGPQGAGDSRLIPWISLLVLKEDEFTRNRIPGRPLTSIVVKAGNPADLFPPASQLWAWAHTQIVADLGSGASPDAGALNSVLANTPDVGLSRIVSPRKLDPAAAYYAFVVPTFNVGRMAGLGLPFDDETTSGLDLAWDNAGEFPVYHEWFFRTGERGDFEELARRLIPRVVPPEVGIRDMDVATADFGMTDLPLNSPHKFVGLEGALKAPTTVSRPHRNSAPFAAEVSAIVNQPAEAEANGDPDPIVAPPIYGRWHALVNSVDPAPNRRGWVDSLNRDARFRTAAGLGAEVIRRNQEMFMKRAWEQVGEILEANRKIALAQAAVLANKRLLSKTLEAGLDPVETIAIAGNLSKRLKLSTKTLTAEIAGSRVTQAALSGPMRKMTRMRGAVEKRLVAAEGAATATVNAPRLASVAKGLNTAELAAGPKPDKITVVTLEDGLDFVAKQTRDGGRPTGPAGPVGPAVPVTRPGPVITTGPRRSGISAGAARGGRVFGLPDTATTGRAGGIAGFASRGTVTPDIPRGTAALGDFLTTGSGAVGTLAVADAIVAKRFDGIGFSKDQILAAQVKPGFVVSAPPGSAAITLNADGLGTTRQVQLQQSFADFSNLLNLSLPDAPARQRIDTAKAGTTLLTALQPDHAFRRRLDHRIALGSLRLDHFSGGLVDTPRERIVPAMACPDFKDPMYKHLTALGDDFLVPNLGLVAPNTISLMLTNPSFIEAYMVGLNHEFSSELLFREYPTDQRCSAFRQFWDVASIPIDPAVTEQDHIAAHKDILPVHTWGRSSRLGTNSPRTAGSTQSEPRVVLVIRGDLLRKYPNTIIYAQSARFGIGARKNELILHDEDGSNAAADINDPDIHFPTFKAQVSPDLHFIGFDLTLSQVRGHPDLEETAAARRTIPADQLGKYFVIQEVVGEARFGLDVSAPSQPSDEKWDNLSWENIDLSSGPVVNVSKAFSRTVSGTDTTGINWGDDAAAMAAILYQKPAMLAIHGKEMLKDL